MSTRPASPPANATTITYLVPRSERVIGGNTWLLDALKAHISSGAGGSAPERNTMPFQHVADFNSLPRSKKITTGVTTSPQSVVDPRDVEDYVRRHSGDFPGVDPRTVSMGFRVNWSQWAILMAQDADIFSGDPPKGVLKERKTALANAMNAYADIAHLAYADSQKIFKKLKLLVLNDITTLVITAIQAAHLAAENRTSASTTGDGGAGLDHGDVGSYSDRAASDFVAALTQYLVPAAEKAAEKAKIAELKTKADAIHAVASQGDGDGALNTVKPPVTRTPGAAKTMAKAMDTSAQADLKFGEAAVTRAEASSTRKEHEARDCKRKLELDSERLEFEKESFAKKLKADEDKEKRAVDIRKYELESANEIRKLELENAATVAGHKATAANQRHELEKADREANRAMMANVMKMMAAQMAAQAGK